MIEAVRAGLAALADPAKAPGMQAYMKSDMPFYGVQKPARAVLAREVFAAHALPTFEAWRDTVLALWRDATYREERYMAMRSSRTGATGPFARWTRCRCIGWALRSYAWVEPEAVIAYCDAHELSPLSRREALKNVAT